MVQQKDVQGKIYHFKGKSEIAEDIETPDLPDSIRLHMVLVLDVVKGKRHHVKIMVITSTTFEDGEFVPISPTRKKPYPIQLRLRSHTAWDHGALRVKYPSLGPSSYLKIDEYYEVPIQMLKEATDRAGNPFVLVAKGQGGAAQLRHHVLQCDRRREAAKVDIGTGDKAENEIDVPTAIGCMDVQDN